MNIQNWIYILGDGWYLPKINISWGCIPLIYVQDLWYIKNKSLITYLGYNRRKDCQRIQRRTRKYVGDFLLGIRQCERTDLRDKDWRSVCLGKPD